MTALEHAVACFIPSSQICARVGGLGEMGRSWVERAAAVSGDLVRLRREADFQSAVMNYMSETL